MTRKSQFQWELEQKQNSWVRNAVVGFTLFIVNYGAISAAGMYPEIAGVAVAIAAILSGLSVALFAETNLFQVFCLYFMALITTHLAGTLFTVLNNGGVEVSSVYKMFLPQEVMDGSLVGLTLFLFWLALFSAIIAISGTVGLMKAHQPKAKKK